MRPLPTCVVVVAANLLAPLAAQQSGAVVRAPFTQPLLRELLLPGFRIPVVPIGLVNSRICDGRLCVALGDVDGDLDQDVVYGPVGNQRPRVLLNDGHGRLTEVTATAMPLELREVYQIALGDLDGDGDLDYVSANRAGSAPRAATILINDGTGRFSDETTQRGLAWASFQVAPLSCVALADFDGDRDTDIVLAGTAPARQSASGFLLRNDGLGRFTYDATAFPTDNGFRDPPSLPGFRSADMDRDGDVDLVARCLWSGFVYWINDGTGHFTDAMLTHVHPTPTSYASIGLDIADMDGDGDLDLVLARYYPPAPVLLFLNDGTGHLYESSGGRIPTDSIAPLSPCLLDIDGDSDTDIVGFRTPQAPNFAGDIRVLVNDGTGRFSLDSGESYLARDQPNGVVYYVVAADMDGDEDQDMLLADGCTVPAPSGRQRYFVNRTRHVWADTPPKRALPWRVRVSGLDGGLALLAISFTNRNAVPSPFGRLALDPATTVVWPFVLQFDQFRLAIVDVPIPDLPILAGRPLYAQALCVEPSGRARFSNLWVENSIR